MSRTPKSEKKMEKPIPVIKIERDTQEHMQQALVRMEEFRRDMQKKFKEIKQEIQEQKARNNTSSNNTDNGRGKTGKKRKSIKKHRSRKSNKK
jgi:hypothetical protein